MVEHIQMDYGRHPGALPEQVDNLGPWDLVHVRYDQDVASRNSGFAEESHHLPARPTLVLERVLPGLQFPPRDFVHLHLIFGKGEDILVFIRGVVEVVGQEERLLETGEGMIRLDDHEAVDHVLQFSQPHFQNVNLVGEQNGIVHFDRLFSKLKT